ncbi:cytochrome-c peroxidase [Sphingobacterium lumbrici]|uniref:cytochrome-c peroxidase n=1 Tax=Sphingobacterium lumbrici TaxID=2559600 RepID=UPI001127ACD6|nr:cytochrome c peroxidase [Sphingobacterium lumbrici]
MSKLQILFFIGIIGVVIACQKTDDKLDTLLFEFVQPEHFPAPVYNLASNPISKEGFELGRKLFYDPILSRNNTISCGSCHISQHAFTHHGHDVSHGIDDRLGVRNSMPLMNLAWSKGFFWDGGVFHLDLAPIAPIENEAEMDEQFVTVLEKLRNSKDYPTLFQKAFGSSEINSVNTLQALSQFMLLLISDNSKYDQVIRKETNFSAAEQRGYTLYQQKCSTCHQEPLFTDYSYRDNGLGINPTQDQGRYEITGLESDKLKFKVPSLRNLAYTSPYMHDGSFITLEAVINHYRREIKQTDNLDPLLRDGITLSNIEISDLTAFLNTLNDEKFIRNTLFSEQP